VLVSPVIFAERGSKKMVWIAHFLGGSRRALREQGHVHIADWTPKRLPDQMSNLAQTNLEPGVIFGHSQHGSRGEDSTPCYAEPPSRDDP
jgi:hypothetical protein